MIDIRKVAVVGAGVMGRGIAAHVANAGVPVLLLDIVPPGATNRNTLAEMFAQSQPEIVIHNANHVPAERAFRDPVEAFSTNLMGTVNVLEEARLTKSVRAVVIVTSASCYENRGAALSCREEDAIGGSDPHCASLAAVELAAAAYFRSFFQNTSTGIATAQKSQCGSSWRTACRQVRYSPPSELSIICMWCRVIAMAASSPITPRTHARARQFRDRSIGRMSRN